MATREHKHDVKIDDIGHLYIMTFKIGHAVYLKIGRTSDPQRRLNEYNMHLPMPLFSYEFVSSKMYNISNIENNLIIAMNGYAGLCNVENRFEWFMKSKKGLKRSMSLEWHIKKIIKEIKKYEESYYEE